MNVWASGWYKIRGMVLVIANQHRDEDARGNFDGVDTARKVGVGKVK